jgi:hypothetical protein
MALVQAWVAGIGRWNIAYVILCISAGPLWRAQGGGGSKKPDANPLSGHRDQRRGVFRSW